MKLFGRRKDRQAKPCTVNINDDIIEIVTIISNKDKTIIQEMEKCISDPKEYFDTHADIFDEWFMNDRFDDQEICKVTMVYLLEQGNYVCLRDWKDEKEDFVYFVQELENFKRLGLDIDEDMLNEEDDISIWSGILDDRWKDSGCCLADINIGSDNYVLFACETDTLKRLQELDGPDGSKVYRASDV